MKALVEGQNPTGTTTKDFRFRVTARVVDRPARRAVFCFLFCVSVSGKSSVLSTCNRMSVASLFCFADTFSTLSRPAQQLVLAAANANATTVLAIFVWNTLHNMDTQRLLWALLLLLFLILRDLVHSNGLNLPDAQWITYSRDVLLELGFNPHFITTTDSFPGEILRINSSNPSNSTHHKHKLTGRGKKKGGIRARLRREACKQQPLPL